VLVTKAGDAKAMAKWNEIPKDIQEKILDNVFCRNCMTTTIVDYEIHLERGNMAVLSGKCKKCGVEVARVLD